MTGGVVGVESEALEGIFLVQELFNIHACIIIMRNEGVIRGCDINWTLQCTQILSATLSTK